MDGQEDFPEGFEEFLRRLQDAEQQREDPARGKREKPSHRRRKKAEESSQVIVARLEEHEIRMWREFEYFRELARKAEKVFEARKHSAEAARLEFWIQVEERLGVPTEINLEVNGETWEIRMDRNDAIKCGLLNG